MRRFPFVQFEFTHSIGPPAGRYLVHSSHDEAEAVLDELDAPFEELTGVAAEAGTAAAATRPSYGVGIDDDSAMVGAGDVLVVRVIGAPPARSGLRLGRQRSAAPEVDDGEPPRDVSLTQATVVFGTRLLDSDSSAQSFYASVRERETDRDQWVHAALQILNRAVSAYRVCAADPYVVDVSPLDPRAIRVGYGVAELVSVGKWERAIAVPAPPAVRLSRDQRLMPTQAMGSLLVGDGRTLEAEELLLRASLDLDQLRVRGAAVGLHAAFELLLGELSGDVLSGAVRTQLDRLSERRSEIAELAAAARRGPLEHRDVERLAALVEDAGAVVDRWRYEKLGFA